nr:MAG TPA: hypothetical protein [Caudoviricetes sp.]DAU82287.1 MAG TPA: hypothetical protein [Caudoviricetes sp.]
MGAISKRKWQPFGTAPLYKFLRKVIFLKIRKYNDNKKQEKNA